MTLHADALAVLRGWTAPDPGQEELRQRYVSHLERHPDGLARSCRPDHVTASTVVLSADLTRTLLTLHPKAGRWFQVGGHCEADDATLVGAAQREAREETGLVGLRFDPVPVHLSAHEVPFCGGPGSHHLDVRFRAIAPPDAEPVISEESLDLRWWPVDDLPDPELEPMLRLATSSPR